MKFDPMGDMYVADRANHRIQFFPAGEQIIEFKNSSVIDQQASLLPVGS